MKIRFWRRLHLRQRATHANSVNMMFYDISFSASVSALAYGLRSTMLACEDGCSEATAALGSLMLLFVPMWWNTYLLNLYCHRFSTEDLFFTVYLYVQILCNLVMAVTSVDCREDSQAFCEPLFFNTMAHDSFAVFAGTQGVSQFMAAAMFSRGMHIPQARLWSVMYATASGFAAVLWCISAATSAGVFRASLVFVTMLVHLFTEAASKSPGIAFPSPLPGYLGERIRKFIIVMMTLIVSGTFSPVNFYSTSMLLAGAGLVMVAVLFKVLYFDLDNGDDSSNLSGVGEVVWVLAVLFLSASFSVTGACSTVVVLHPHLRDDVASVRVRWLLCTSSAVGLLASTVTKAVQKRKRVPRRCSYAGRLGLRVVGAAVIGFLPVIIGDMAPVGLVWLVAALLAVQMLVDMYVGAQLVSDNDASACDALMACLVTERAEHSEDNMYLQSGDAGSFDADASERDSLIPYLGSSRTMLSPQPLSRPPERSARAARLTPLSGSAPMSMHLLSQASNSHNGTAAASGASDAYRGHTRANSGQGASAAPLLGASAQHGALDS